MLDRFGIYDRAGAAIASAYEHDIEAAASGLGCIIDRNKTARNCKRYTIQKLSQLFILMVGKTKRYS